ncbi:MAG: phosphoenolpyruvate--protein phosphotransferase [Hahellaceae bacterium]|nr:phosphoenolpyruvate--protein phosphotransferase [Hahellaceae bacterium]
MLEPLKTLRLIFQEAADLHQSAQLLDLIVARVQAALGADVCSVYLLNEETSELVLMATRGLDASSVGKVRLPKGEGLVGQIARHQSLLNIPDAALHPAYRYFPETGEESFHSFLGAPIISFRRLLGVIVVQRAQREFFSDEEEAFLITVAAQLAGPIREILDKSPLITEQVADDDALQSNLKYKGVKGASGMAWGTLYWVSHTHQLSEAKEDYCDEPDAEIERFRDALSRAKQELRAGGERMQSSLPKDVQALFGVYRMIMEDKELAREIENHIQGGWNAETALRKTMESHARIFESMDDAYLRAKAEDIRHIGERVYASLMGNEKRAPLPTKGQVILIGRNISIADIAQFPAQRLAGLICTSGSSLSHLAILANALGIPAVMGIGEVKASLLHGREAVIDGYRAIVIFNPVANLRREYRKLAQQEKKLVSGLNELKDLPAMTPDGFRVKLMANTGLLADITPGLLHGAEGVGLYRSEIPFMVHESFPSEDEQVALYRSVLEAYAPRMVSMRTLDIGGDKPLPYYAITEDNPFLGWRGIRFSLDNTSIFLSQIRAMLKASSGLENLRILLPMVSQIEEVKAFRVLLDEALEQLRSDGEEVRCPEVGAMIEVPSVIHVIDQLSRYVQFVSIGSNDYTQYLMAVDRNNPKVSELYDWLNPAVLRSLHGMIKSARRYQLDVSLCGEMASDPAAVLLLIGMGLDMLSLSAYNLPKTKWVIRTVPKSECDKLLAKALKAENPKETRKMLEATLDRYGLGGLIRAGA